MKKQKAVLVQPRERFHILSNRKRTICPGEMTFVAKSKYYHCPKCEKKTLIRRSFFDAWNPTPSVFPKELIVKFPPEKSYSRTFDFYCKNCKSPVRVFFWERERGMGGSWYPLIQEIYELIDEK